MNRRPHPRRLKVRKALACGLIPLAVLTTAGKCSGLAACARGVIIVDRVVEDGKKKQSAPSAPATPDVPHP